MSLLPHFETEWTNLLAQGSAKSFHAGEMLYMQGQKDAGLICLKKGRIKNCVYFPSGIEKITSVLDAPNITGETTIIDDKGSLTCSVALTDVEVQVIPTEKARVYLEKNPEIMALILQFYAKKIRSIQLQAESAVLSIPQKLAHMLVNFDSYGFFSQENDAQPHVTHEQLASFLGTTRPKITNTLNMFEQERFIKKGRGTIEILDYEGLRSLLE